MILPYFILCLSIWAIQAQNRGCRVDLTIVLDKSGSITHNPNGPPVTANFDKVRTFVKNIVNNPQIQINAQETHLALLLFEYTPVLKASLSNYDKSKVISALDSAIAWGASNPDKALEMVRNKVYTGPGNRPDVTDVVLFIGDGDVENGYGPNKTAAFINQARLLKQNKAIIITVGVGMHLQTQTLKSVATDNNHYFNITDLNALKGKVMDIVLKACSKSAITTTTTSRTTTTTTPTTTTTQPVQDVSGDCVYDIVLVVDRSGSIIKRKDSNGKLVDDLSIWYKIANFVINLIPEFVISSSGTHLGVISFANLPRLEIPLDLYDNNERAKLLNLLKNGRPEENMPAWGKSSPYDAFLHVRNKVFGKAGDRSNAPNVIIYVGDGEQNIGGTVQNFKSVANQLKASDVTIISVGVGYLLNETTLKDISSEPTFYFGDKNPDKLESYIPYVTSLACGKSPPSQELPPVPTEPPTIPPLGDKCPADIVFVMDSSGSIEDSNKGNYKLLKTFLTDIVQKIEIGKYLTRVGLVRFSNNAKSIFYLNSSYVKEEIIGNISKIGYVGGTTNIAEALQLVYKEQFLPISGDRKGIENVVIFVTDGNSTVNAKYVKSNATMVRNKKIKVFAVGITKNIVESELISIASGNPPVKGTNYFTTANFTTLSQVISMIFQNGGCLVPARDITCRESADVYIVLDTSGTIDTMEFEVMKKLAKELAADVGMGNPDTGIGLIAFTGKPASAQIVTDINYYFENRYLPETSVYREIENVKHTTGTNLIEAIRKLNEAFNTNHGARKDLNNIAVIFTDGEIKARDRKNLLDEVYRTKMRSNITFIVVGIGPDSRINTFILRTMASYPHEATFVHVPSFTDLKGDVTKLTQYKHLRAMVCNDIDECDTNPCQCSASCHDLRGRHYCDCPKGCGGVSCEYECHAPREVVFAVDAADGISEDQFRNQLDLVRDAVIGMNIDFDGSKVGLLGFSDAPYERFHLNTHAGGFRSKLNIVNAITLHFAGGATNTHRAINHMTFIMFRPERGDTTDIPNVGVILSDGRTTDFRQTWTEAVTARNRGIRLISVNIGNGAPQTELEGIANGPVNASIINVGDFSSLKDSTKHVINAICNSVNDCSPNYCLNGMPVDEINHCRCICRTGYSGNRCERGCGSKKDIAILIDNSGSIGRDRLIKVLEFATTIVREYQVAENLTRIAVITFNDRATVELKFNKYYLRQDVVTAIRQIKYAGGKTNIADALNKAYNEVFIPSNGDRPEAPNYVILFTDGQPNINSQMTLPTAIKLKVQKQVNITVFGIGSDVNNHTLIGLASEPVDQMVIHLYRTLYLDNAVVAKSIRDRIVGSTCNEVNDCRNNPCRNGGKCVDRLLRNSCICNSARNLKSYYAGITCTKLCTRAIDLSLILDLSGSMDMVYSILINATKQIVAAMPIDEDIVRVSVMTYDDRPTLQFYFNKYNGNKMDMQNALAFVNENMGKTNTRDALNKMTNEVFNTFNGHRNNPDVQKVGVIFTDGGGSPQMSQTEVEAKRAIAKGIELYVVAIGTQPNMKVIKTIAQNTEPIRIVDGQQITSGVSNLINKIAKCVDT